MQQSTGLRVGRIFLSVPWPFPLLLFRRIISIRQCRRPIPLRKPSAKQRDYGILSDSKYDKEFIGDGERQRYQQWKELKRGLYLAYSKPSSQKLYDDICNSIQPPVTLIAVEPRLSVFKACQGDTVTSRKPRFSPLLGEAFFAEKQPAATY